ncbi:MAG: type II secretion system minor pseudopilin GspK [Gammaproteobacteria bacterium]|nr:type II secretion system minor pseudopilin GspK [Gammaproteobacteria bacterium]
MSLHKQSGVVIVVALFVVALIATMAYFMMMHLYRDTRRTALILRQDQASFYAQGSLNWAKDQLRNNWDVRKPDQPIDILPIKSPIIKVDGFQITSKIEDIQARFNINNLQNAEVHVDFKRLLQTVIPELNEEQLQTLLTSIFDWISAQHPDSPTQQYYLRLPEPYRPAHRLMVSLSELQLVKGMTKPMYERLKPFLIALPESTKINVRTASPQVLLTLSPTLTLAGAQIIERVRKQNPLATLNDILTAEPLRKFQLQADKTTLDSEYFLVETEVRIEKQRIVLYTLLNRKANENSVDTIVIWQSKGMW